MDMNISKGKTRIDELLNCHDISSMHTTHISRRLQRRKIMTLIDSKNEHNGSSMHGICGVCTCNTKGRFVVKPTVMMTVVSFCLDGVPLSRARIVKV